MVNFDFYRALRIRIAADFGSQKKYAEFLGVSCAMVSAVLRGKKTPTKQMLDDLGYEKRVVKRIYYDKK